MDYTDVITVFTCSACFSVYNLHKNDSRICIAPWQPMYAYNTAMLLCKWVKNKRLDTFPAPTPCRTKAMSGKVDWPLSFTMAELCNNIRKRYCTIFVFFVCISPCLGQNSCNLCDVNKITEKRREKKTYMSNVEVLVFREINCVYL